MNHTLVIPIINYEKIEESLKRSSRRNSKRAKGNREDILQLKAQRQSLIYEKRLLNTKIARYNNLLHNFVAKSPNKKNQDSLINRISSLNQMINQKKTEISNVVFSDIASNIVEMQEEAKILFLEIQRNKKLHQLIENDLISKKSLLEETLAENSQEKYDQLVRRHMKILDSINSTKTRIISLEDRIQNDKIKKPVLQEEREQLLAEISQLDSLIHQENKAIQDFSLLR